MIKSNSVYSSPLTLFTGYGDVFIGINIVEVGIKHYTTNQSA